MRKITTLLLCLALHGMTQAQNSTIDYRYWFDEESSSAVSGSFKSTATHINVKTDGLDDNPHQLHIQLRDTSGIWSAPITRQFLRQTVDSTKPFNYRIWNIEDVNSTISGSISKDTLHIDMKNVPEGPRRLYVQASQNGYYSVPVMRTFIKLPHIEGMKNLFCMMYIDGSPYRMESVPMSGGNVNWVVGADSIKVGIHSYSIMAITPNGSPTSIREGFFVRENMESEVVNQHCCYQIDGGNALVAASTKTGKQFHFDLDMSGLQDGVHRLVYWLVSDNGATTDVRSTLFIKSTPDNKGITQYEYWVNNEQDTRHIVSLNTPEDPMNLITMIPVEQAPLRSSCFQFAFRDGLPVVFAKNTLHVRFQDTYLRYAETSKDYVDENVWEEVIPVNALQETQTFDKVADNAIRWYTLVASPGDTVKFKSNLACSIQLFAPSGEEILSVNGNASISFEGCATMEHGTYYLAIHDVTGNGAQLTLQYQHADWQTDIQRGDANGDRNVNVADVMMVVNYILNKQPNNFHEENADVNKDGRIDVTDVMSIVKIILNSAMSSAPILRTNDHVDAITVNGGIDLTIENSSRYTAIEMTLNLPRGATLAKTVLTDKNTDHRAETHKMGDGQYRIVVFSLNGETLPDNETLIHMDIAGGMGVAKVSNVVLANTLYEALAPQEDESLTNITTNITNDISQTDTPEFGIGGQRTDSKYRGILITKGRKHVVK